MDIDLVRTANGKKPADLAIVNGKIVNVYTDEIYDGGISVCNGKIAAIGDIDYTIGATTEVIDAAGCYLSPGFIDGHLHPESTNLSLLSLSQLLLKHGTTSIMTDLHECGVVGGLEAIEAVLNEMAKSDLHVYFVVPSHVPFSPELETSGGEFDVDIIRKALQHKDAVGLSECVCTYISSEYQPLLQSIMDTRELGKTVHGHMPGVNNNELMACLAAGLKSDHESFNSDDVLSRLRAGCHVMIREGSVARSLNDCLAPLLDSKVSLDRASVITDDLHTIDLVENGHMDHILRKLINLGVNFSTGIKMITLNPARAYGLDEDIGGLAPGRRADINFINSMDKPEVVKVFSDGKLVMEDGKFLHPYPPVTHAPFLLNTCQLKNPITPDSFIYQVEENVKAVEIHVIQTNHLIPVSEERIAVLPVKNGVIQCSPEEDILYVAQVERYGKNGNIGKAFMGGFNIQDGAIASSVGHDNHNIIVLGTNHEDMAMAVNRVVTLGGGQVAVRNEEVIGEIAYPILGLMTDMEAVELSLKKKHLISKIEEMGSKIKMPFMFLSFLCLAAGGGYAITDHGFIDSANQCVADPIIKKII